MQIDCVTLNFNDILINEHISIGQEHSVHYHDETGGIRRLLNCPRLKKNIKLNIHAVGEKRSIIFRQGAVKTTLTEMTYKKNMTGLLNPAWSDVLVSYAEDFEWTYDKTNITLNSLWVDFSGRFKNVDEFKHVMKCCSVFSRDCFAIITDHDNLSHSDILDLSYYASQVIYHSPKQIVIYSNGKCLINLGNEYFKETMEDFVGLGDFLAVNLIELYQSRGQIDASSLNWLQKEIRDLIDEKE